MKGKGVFSHESDHWATPKKLYNWFMRHDFIDPCPLHSKEDNLDKIYEGKKLFINPPYSQIDKWTEFIKRNLPHCLDIWLLIPARTDTKYFHELLKLHPNIYFIKGRLHFNESGTAPFPSILMRFVGGLYFTFPWYFPLKIEEFIKK